MKRIIRIATVCLALLAGGVTAVYASAAERIEAIENEAHARPVSGGIEITSADQLSFEIYSITGQKVKIVSVKGESVTVELPKGCYIVRCPQWSKKVVVK